MLEYTTVLRRTRSKNNALSSGLKEPLAVCQTILNIICFNSVVSIFRTRVLLAGVILVSGKLKYHLEIRIQYPHAWENWNCITPLILTRYHVDVAEGEPVWSSKKIRLFFIGYCLDWVLSYACNMAYFRWKDSSVSVWSVKSVLCYHKRPLKISSGY